MVINFLRNRYDIELGPHDFASDHGVSIGKFIGREYEDRCELRCQKQYVRTLKRIEFVSKAFEMMRDKVDSLETELRQDPWVIETYLPAPDEDDALYLWSIYFKLDNNGTTYILQTIGDL
jgi:hypothetical protein